MAEGLGQTAGYSEPEPPVQEEAAQSQSRGMGLVDRWLLGIVGLALVVFLVGAISLVLYVLSMRNAPRTVVEQQLKVDQVAVQEHPKDVDNWARLALSSADAKKWRDAQTAIDNGRKVKKAAILDLVEARVLYLRKDPKALVAYENAIKSARREMDEQAKKFRDTGITMPVSTDLLFEAMWGRVNVLADDGRTKDAITQAKEAIKLAPTDAGAHAKLGDMLAASGQAKEAEAQYREALTYVPDLDEALAGLKRLGKEK